MLRHTPVAGGILLLAACSHNAPPPPVNAIANMQVINPESSVHLATATDGQLITLSESPWGPGAVVEIQKRYFAASGRVCLQALANQQPVLICDFQAQGWAAQRLINQQD